VSSAAATAARVSSGGVWKTPKPIAGRMLAGVAGGIARHLNADVTLVRVIIAALALFTGVGAALYIAAWLLIPADGDDESIAAAWIARRQDRSR